MQSYIFFSKPQQVVAKIFKHFCFVVIFLQLQMHEPDSHSNLYLHIEVGHLQKPNKLFTRAK